MWLAQQQRGAQGAEHQLEHKLGDPRLGWSMHQAGRDLAKAADGDHRGHDVVARDRALPTP